MPSLEPPPSQDVPVDAPQFRQWLYNLWAVTAASTASITSIISANLVSFIQLGVGAVTRTIQDKAREIVSVKDFGAVGDGVVNDSAAIGAAVTYALTQYGCGVFFPTGRYLCNSTVTILGGIYLKSDGAYIINGQTNAPAIKFGDGVTRYYGGGVFGLWFTGKSGVVGVAGQAGLYCLKMGQMNFQHCRSNLLGSALYNAFIFNDISQFTVCDLEAQNCIDTGIKFITCGDGKISQTRSDGNAGDGVSLDNCQGMNFTDVNCYSNSGYAWRLQSTSPATLPNYNNWFAHCVGDTSGNSNWFIADSYDSHFIACWGSTQQSTAVNTMASGFYIVTSKCKNLNFIGGLAAYNNGSGVNIDATISAPINIFFTDFTFGTIANNPNGNGRAGAGYGLAISGGNTGPIRIKGGYFAGNASGPYLNNVTITGDVVISEYPSGALMSGRMPSISGTTTASANNLILPYDGAVFVITGITQINGIDFTGWNNGNEILLKFASTPTVKNGVATAGNIKNFVLAGAVDFVPTANSVLKLFYDGNIGAWVESGRVVR